MIRFLFRSVGFVLLAAAFAALVVDGSRSIAGGRALFTSLDGAAAWLGMAQGGGTFAAGWPGPVREAAAGLLGAPAWIVTAVVGVLLLRLGRPAAESAGLARPRT